MLQLNKQFKPKQIKRFFFVTLCPGVLIFLLLWALPPVNHSLNSQETFSTEELKAAVQKMGRLKFTGEVTIRYLDRDNFRRYAEALVEAQYPDEAVEKDAWLIRSMGYFNGLLDLKAIRKKILGNSAGCIYNHSAKEVVALESFRTLDTMNSMIMVHALRQAIQDQHFEITGVMHSNLHTFYDDRRLAAGAACEGDAAFVMISYSGFKPEVMSATLSSDPLLSFSPLGNTAQLSKSPEVVKQLYMMPYINGARFVTEVFKKKKWRGVNRILNTPPQSSAQILHPEKYLKQEAPVRLSIDYRPRDKGYRLYHTGVLGEHLLSTLLRDPKSYRETAQGWRGDAFHLFRKDKSHFLLVLKSLWEDEKSCGTVFVDLKKFIERTFLVNFKKGKVRNSMFIAGSSADGRDYFFLRRVEKRMIFVRTNDKDQMNHFIFGGNYD